MREYEKLLDFLDTLKQKSIIEEKQPSKTLVEAKKQKIVSAEIDKLIEEAQITTTFESPLSTQSSKGFDVIRFETLMRAKLIEEYKKLQSYDRPYIAVTELFSCMRSNYYNRVKYQVDVKDLFQFSYLKLIQDVGNTIHFVVQSVYDFTETEKTIISEKYKVKGRMDAAKENFLYEIKTVDTNKFSGRYNHDHYQQGNIYAHILNNEYSYSIDTVILLYFCRDNLKKRPFVFDIPIDPKSAEFYLSKANVLLSNIQRKEVPDVIGSNEEQCKYCIYKKYCEKDDSKTKKPYDKKQTIIEEKKKKEPIKTEEKKKTAFLI